MGKAAARTGCPEDWSQHQLVFSAPRNAAEAVELSKNPRYQQQWLRRNAPPALGAVGDNAGSGSTGTGHGWFTGFGSDKQNSLHYDWSTSLGPGGTVGAGQYPAKYSFIGSAANCAGTSQPDFVVYNTSLAGSATQATIMAFDNIYSSCIPDGFVPTSYWAYNTGGTAQTSPTLSIDGTQVAFVQNVSGSAELVVLKWAAAGGTVGSPGTITYYAPANYRSCAAPCYTEVSLSGATSGDSNSGPFVDYGHDILWVGEDTGSLHEVTSVFTGTPAELITSGEWPATVSAGSVLTSPVEDQAAGLIFVGSGNGVLYQVAETNAAITSSAVLSSGSGFVASPVVNATTRTVYAFAGIDGSAIDSTSPCGASADEGCNGVFQFAENFASGSSGSETVLGPAPGGTLMYHGDFDNAYYTSTNATGNMYVCGTAPGGGGAPALYRIPITAGVMQAHNGSEALTSGSTQCSPITEFYNSNLNNGTDSIFFSVQLEGLGTGCSGSGCVGSNVITEWQPNTRYAVGQMVLDSRFSVEIVFTGGTSGASQPLWNRAAEYTTYEGTVNWVSQGVPSIVLPGAWARNTSYAVGRVILDSNGNFEYCVRRGTSGGGAPVWSRVINYIINDGGATWRNLGPPSANSFEASGGTSGIIVDNSSSVVGASEIYFSNLSSGSPNCGSGDTCAVQVSQAKLR